MSFDLAIEELKARFTTAWAARTKVRFPNEAWKDPKDGTGKALPYVFFEVVEGDSDLIGGASGNRVEVYDGVMQIHAYVPQGTGESVARAMATVAGDIFAWTTIAFGDQPELNRIRCFTPRQNSAQPGGADETGNLFRVTSVVPLQYDRTVIVQR